MGQEIRLILSDGQWQRIEQLCVGKAGDPCGTGADNRTFVEAVLWDRPRRVAGLLAGARQMAATVKGLSRWLFIGRITASIAFVIYSWVPGNRVFVVTNALMLATAVMGDCVLLTNRTSAAFSDRGR